MSYQYDDSLSDTVAVVNAPLCVGCGKCVDMCPSGAISVDTYARIELAYCIGCAQCIRGCRFAAIDMRKRPNA